jgi:hypothetical protein
MDAVVAQLRRGDGVATLQLLALWRTILPTLVRPTLISAEPERV